MTPQIYTILEINHETCNSTREIESVVGEETAMLRCLQLAEEELSQWLNKGNAFIRFQGRTRVELWDENVLVYSWLTTNDSKIGEAV